jgi:putative component of membrane protein insertase Oxa1/YidC/SpoIIIJ protein YidD
MSALRQRLKHPATYLAALGVLAMAVAFDTGRAPERQLTARVYLAAVERYQHSVSPQASKFVACRYAPTCSHYSAEVVRRFGLRRGLWLSAARLWRCRASVPLGTPDPVPAIIP